MANDLNIVSLIGRLTRDPELKTIGSGTSLCKISIANNRSYTSGGEKREEVNYFNATAWGKRAEVLAQYARKGSQLAISGSLKQRTWDGTDGKKQSAIDITIEDFQFLGGKREGSQSNSQDSGYQPDAPSGDYPDDDISF
jgi:single-strand DNA-binding protein